MRIVRRLGLVAIAVVASYGGYLLLFMLLNARADTQPLTAAPVDLADQKVPKALPPQLANAPPKTIREILGGNIPSRPPVGEQLKGGVAFTDLTEGEWVGAFWEFRTTASVATVVDSIWGMQVDAACGDAKKTVRSIDINNQHVEVLQPVVVGSMAYSMCYQRWESDGAVRMVYQLAEAVPMLRAVCGIIVITPSGRGALLQQWDFSVPVAPALLGQTVRAGVTRGQKAGCQCAKSFLDSRY